MKASWAASVAGHHRDLRHSGLWRERKTLESAQSVVVALNGGGLLNFSSNDYLGLANNEHLKQAACAAVSEWGVGSGASHLVCGHSQPHHLLEQNLAEFVGAERAILFSNGYLANLAIGSAFLNNGDLFLHDKLNHASLIDAGLASASNFKRYSHTDLAHAQKIIEKTAHERLMIASDAVFSMDGNTAPIGALNELALKHDALLVLDDAHGFGVLGRDGRGSLNELGLVPAGNVLMMGTLGKAFASFGAFIAGDEVYIEHLIQRARSYIYTTALPPSIAVTSSASLQYVRAQKGRLQHQLKSNIDYFKAQAKLKQLRLMPSNTPIQPVMVGDSWVASAISEKMAECGVLLTAIRPPTVPKGTARLRVALSAAHTNGQIDRLIDALLKSMDELADVNN